MQNKISGQSLWYANSATLPYHSSLKFCGKHPHLEVHLANVLAIHLRSHKLLLVPRPLNDHENLSLGIYATMFVYIGKNGHMAPLLQTKLLLGDFCRTESNSRKCPISSSGADQSYVPPEIPHR